MSNNDPGSVPGCLVGCLYSAVIWGALFLALWTIDGLLQQVRPELIAFALVILAGMGLARQVRN